LPKIGYGPNAVIRTRNLNGGFTRNPVIATGCGEWLLSGHSQVFSLIIF
jgi:hypothetical protein